MLKGLNTAFRLIAVQWQEQLHASCVWGYIKIEWTVASGYQTKVYVHH